MLFGNKGIKLIYLIKNNMSKVALITGLSGQDGSYLAELLLEKGYNVYGIERRLSVPNDIRTEKFKKKIKKIYVADLSSSAMINKIIGSLQPDEIYNLAAQSQVQVSFDLAEYTADVNAIGTLRILEAIKNFSPKSKFYQASTSEMFGKVQETPQTEKTPFYPRSPYGVSKLFAHWMTKNYRESHDIFACSGILFNHESPRRGIDFVTRKITNGIARIAAGFDEVLELGNLDTKRDWG